jgi:hypothetical protein
MYHGWVVKTVLRSEHIPLCQFNHTPQPTLHFLRNYPTYFDLLSESENWNQTPSSIRPSQIYFCIFGVLRTPKQQTATMSNSRTKASSVTSDYNAENGGQHQSTRTQRGVPCGCIGTISVVENVADQRSTQHIGMFDLFTLHLCKFLILVYWDMRRYYIRYYYITQESCVAGYSTHLSCEEPETLTSRINPFTMFGDWLIFYEIVVFPVTMSSLIRLGLNIAQDCVLCWQKTNSLEPPTNIKYIFVHF